jgi:alpha-mannosidase
VDRGYDKHVAPAKPQNSRIEENGFTVDLLLGSSPASLRFELIEGEPFLRVRLNADWRERRTLLRVENWLAVQTDSVTYGAPHGTIVRSARDKTPEEQAKFEVPGQRFAYAADTDGAGFAMFALDTYGWSARALPKGGIKLGHSLLRGTCWPDPHADEGEQSIAWAIAPLANASNSTAERLWRRFAHEPRVQLFSSSTPQAIVAACKPAEDGDGAIVRVRECDGSPANVRLRCGARMTWAASVDGLERATYGSAAIDGEELVFDLKPYEMRGFRVRFSHA